MTQPIAPPRIGRPVLRYVFAWLFFAIGAILMLVGLSGSGMSPLIWAALFLSAGGALGLQALIVSIGQRLEQRLIEMQMRGEGAGELQDSGAAREAVKPSAEPLPKNGGDAADASMQKPAIFILAAIVVGVIVLIVGLLIR